MSTIRANTLADAAGNNSSTAEQLRQGRAKAWSILNGTGTIAPLDTFNIASHTDNGVGNYTFTLAAAQPSASWLGTYQGNSEGGFLCLSHTHADSNSQNYVAATTTAFRGQLTDLANTARDRQYVQFIANGD
jgi:hypothetical protein